MQTYTVFIDQADGMKITCAPATLLILQHLLEQAGHKFSYTVEQD